jgi:RNA-directed DNA polymerase
MMEGREKSDLAVVAMKPTNKAGKPAAEPVERRAGTKGKANQQSTRRAQDRASVSQALGRVRKAARRRKEKFTALFHHLSPEMLRTAFFALKRDAAPGIDGLRWRDYEADLDRRIETPHPGRYFTGAPGTTAATPSGLMLKARNVKGASPGLPHWCTRPNGS